MLSLSCRLVPSVRLAWTCLPAGCQGSKETLEATGLHRIRAQNWHDVTSATGYRPKRITWPNARGGEEPPSFGGKKNFKVTSQGLWIQGGQRMGALLPSVYHEGWTDGGSLK